MEKITIASDHAGAELKEDIKIFLKKRGCDVPEKVSNGELKKAILICGTGIGMSIVANKFPNVRAALVNDVYAARMAKEHNDANILVIGGRIAGKGLAQEMVKTWLDAKFEGGRHQRRLDKIKEIEKGMKR